MMHRHWPQEHKDKNRVLKSVLGTGKKLKEAAENWMSSPNVIRVSKSKRMRWTDHGRYVGDTKNAHRISVGKYEGSRRRPMRRCELEQILKEIGLQDMDWIHLA
jgi:hypothetical protein